MLYVYTSFIFYLKGKASTYVIINLYNIHVSSQYFTVEKRHKTREPIFCVNYRILKFIDNIYILVRKFVILLLLISSKVSSKLMGIDGWFFKFGLTNIAFK